MPTLVQLPKEIVKAALDQALSLRARNVKAATNTVIKEALEQEQLQIAKALQTLETVPDNNKPK